MTPTRQHLDGQDSGDAHEHSSAAPTLPLDGRPGLNRPPQVRKAVPVSVVRCRGGGFKAIRMAKTAAIKAHCMECLGWEDDPRSCTSKTCPLWVYRGYTRLTQKGDMATPEG